MSVDSHGARRADGLRVVASLLAAQAGLPALAVELRPSINLPTQREVQPAAPVQSAVPAAARMEAYYRQFEADVAAMPDPRREQLRQDLMKRLSTAQKQQRADEVQHYQRMLGIVVSAPKRGSR